MNITTDDMPLLLGKPCLYLKELYSNTGEHELEQRSDDDNVADGPNGHEHTLHNMLENTSEMVVS